MKFTGYYMYHQLNIQQFYVLPTQIINLLNPTGHVMHQQFNLLKPTGCDAPTV